MHIKNGTLHLSPAEAHAFEYLGVAVPSDVHATHQLVTALVNCADNPKSPCTLPKFAYPLDATDVAHIRILKVLHAALKPHCESLSAA